MAAALTAAGLGPITWLHRVAGGWESTIWAAHLDGRELAVRVFSAGRDRVVATTEARVMTTLDRLGYPVPHVHHVSAEAGPALIVMDLVDGGTLWEAPDITREDMAALNAALMAWLHRLDPAAFGMPLHDPLGRLCRQVDAVVARHPGFQPIAGWIRDRAASAGPCEPVPTHRDLHPGNILLDRRHRPFVVDWTSFSLDHPGSDVAWTALLAEMYEGPGMAGAFVEAYRRESGRDVLGPLSLVSAAVRRLADLLFFLSGEGSSAVNPDAGIGGHVSLHRVPAAWIERHTGHRIPEVDSLLAGAGS